MHTTIKTLFEKGYNKTQIGEILGINRKTVAIVLNKLATDGVVERKVQSTILDEFKEYINIQAQKGLSAMRIYQDIKTPEMGYTGGYDTVKKYIAATKVSVPKAYMVLHSLRKLSLLTGIYSRVYEEFTTMKILDIDLDFFWIK